MGWVDWSELFPSNRDCVEAMATAAGRCGACFGRVAMSVLRQPRGQCRGLYAAIRTRVGGVSVQVDPSKDQRGEHNKRSNLVYANAHMRFSLGGGRAPLAALFWRQTKSREESYVVIGMRRPSFCGVVCPVASRHKSIASKRAALTAALRRWRAPAWSSSRAGAFLSPRHPR